MLLMRRIELKQKCARLIQRIGRGFICRCRYREKLLAHYRQEWARIELIRSEIQKRHENNAAIMIQSVLRGRRGRKRFEEERIRQLALQMEKEMDKTVETEEKRRNMLYEQQLRDYWRKQMEILRGEEARKEHKFQEQWRVKTAALKRRWEREVIAEAEAKEAKRLSMLEEDKTWEEMWGYRMEEAFEAERKRVGGLLEAGSESKETREEARNLRREYANRLAALKKRFRGAGLPLDSEDAKTKAKKEVKDAAVVKVHEKLKLSKAADRLAIDERRAQEEREEAERSGNLNELKRKKALHLMQGNIRKYFARCELKKRIRMKYRKEFDPEYLCYYYEHRSNGLTQWEKPQLLGREDLPNPTRWYVILDKDCGRSYYLKPTTAEMSFTIPQGCVMCHKHASHFAHAYCVDCGKNLCKYCLQGERKPGESLLEAVTDHKKHNFVEIEPGIPIQHHSLMCQSCQLVEPVGHCLQCNCAYCEVCWKAYHESDAYPEYRGHSLEGFL